MKRIIVVMSFLALILLSFTAIAAKPVCHSSSGGYCSYKGKVSKVYVNAGNTILLYFEEPLTPSDAQVAGYTVTRGAAGAYRITDNPDFAKMLYSTLLAAKSQDRVVTVQMRGVTQGYLVIDRIWFGD